MENKMTNVKALTFVKDNFELPVEVAEKIDSMIASLQKKSANRKPTKVQLANEVLKKVVLEILADKETPVTVSEILLDERIERGTSSQKISALLKQMAEADNTVVKSTDGKKSVFRLAD